MDVVAMFANGLQFTAGVGSQAWLRSRDADGRIADGRSRMRVFMSAATPLEIFYRRRSLHSLTECSALSP